jgi:hypothetical protein
MDFSICFFISIRGIRSSEQKSRRISFAAQQKKHTLSWQTNVCFFQPNPPLVEEIYLRWMFFI